MKGLENFYLVTGGIASLVTVVASFWAAFYAYFLIRPDPIVYTRVNKNPDFEEKFYLAFRLQNNGIKPLHTKATLVCQVLKLELRLLKGEFKEFMANLKSDGEACVQAVGEEAEKAFQILLRDPYLIEKLNFENVTGMLMIHHRGRINSPRQVHFHKDADTSLYGIQFANHWSFADTVAAQEIFRRMLKYKGISLKIKFEPNFKWHIFKNLNYPDQDLFLN
jgi:hypothetical protein